MKQYLNIETIKTILYKKNNNFIIISNIQCIQEKKLVIFNLFNLKCKI